jgi:hypothetical protein
MATELCTCNAQLQPHDRIEGVCVDPCFWCDRIVGHSEACARATAAETRLREIAPLSDEEKK